MNTEQEETLKTLKRVCKEVFSKNLYSNIEITSKKTRPRIHFIVSEEQNSKKKFISSLENLPKKDYAKFDNIRRTLDISWMELSILAYAISNNLKKAWAHNHVYISTQDRQMTFSTSDELYECPFIKAATFQKCCNAIKEAFTDLRTTDEEELVLKFSANEFFEILPEPNRQAKHSFAISDYF